MYSLRKDGRYIDHSAPCDAFTDAFHTVPKRKEIAAARGDAKVIAMRNWLIENMTFIYYGSAAFTKDKSLALDYYGFSE